MKFEELFLNWFGGLQESSMSEGKWVLRQNLTPRLCHFLKNRQKCIYELIVKQFYKWIVLTNLYEKYNNILLYNIIV